MVQETNKNHVVEVYIDDEDSNYFMTVDVEKFSSEDLLKLESILEEKGENLFKGVGDPNLVITVNEWLYSSKKRPSK